MATLKVGLLDEELEETKRHLALSSGRDSPYGPTKGKASSVAAPPAGPPTPTAWVVEEAKTLRQLVDSKGETIHTLQVRLDETLERIAKFEWEEQERARRKAASANKHHGWMERFSVLAEPAYTGRHDQCHRRISISSML